MRTVKSKLSQTLQRVVTEIAKGFFSLVNWKRWEEKRLLFSENGAEFKDRVVLVPEVKECFTWGFKSEWGIARAPCLLHSGDVFFCPQHSCLRESVLALYICKSPWDCIFGESQAGCSGGRQWLMMLAPCGGEEGMRRQLLCSDR